MRRVALTRRLAATRRVALTRARVVFVLAAGMAVAGCGLLAPVSTRPRLLRSAPARATRSPARPPLSAIAQAQITHEYPSPPPSQRAPGYVSPTAAIEAFATAYINWTAQTVVGDMRSLASASIGQARSAMQLAAADTAADYELHRAGIANSGQVEAVAALQGHAGQYVVVTRERTTATATSAYEGLQPGWHLAIATVSELAPGDWVVSGWQPES
jgi:hypothetical protein